MMTPERIAELRKLCDAATPRSWIEREELGNDHADVDKQFIAAARTSFPELLDEIEWLRDLLRHAVEWLEAFPYKPPATLRVLIELSKKKLGEPCSKSQE